MKVFLRDIPFEGLTVEKSVSAETIGLVDDNFVCLTPLRVWAHFEKTDNELFVNVTVTASYELNCARCLEPVRQERADELEFVFDITSETEFVEWSEDVRQELIVRLSVILRCREDCRGLCQHCGANLNKVSCKCSKSSQNIQGIDIHLKKK